MLYSHHLLSRVNLSVPEFLPVKVQATVLRNLVRIILHFYTILYQSFFVTRFLYAVCKIVCIIVTMVPQVRSGVKLVLL